MALSLRPIGLACAAAVLASSLCGLAFADTGPDLKAVAASMVKAGLVKPDDKVQINGGVRDMPLLENLFIESMKLGAHPLITVDSQKLNRRSFDEVPAAFDSQVAQLDQALVDLFDVQLSVEIGEAEDMMAGVPAARIAARSAAFQPVMAAFLKKGVRVVNLGNGLYPTPALAKRFDISQAQLSATFWKAAMASPELIRAKGDSMLGAFTGGKEVTLSAPNGTQIRFAVAADKGYVSDGTVTAAGLQQGGVATQTWLPAGELLMPVLLGTAEGKVVIDRLGFLGTRVEGLTLNFSQGVLTSMTAKSGLAAVKALYDASTGSKENFAYLDIGLNPAAKFPTDKGRVVWMAPGAVTIGLGDNTAWGGTNVSSFGLAGPITAASLSVDGKVLIKGGALVP